MKRWPVAALFASGLAWAAVSPAHALDHIKINYVEPAPYYAPLFLAIDKGYFAEAGIEAELVQAGGGVATPALIAGDLDFSFVQKSAAALKAENWQPRIGSN